MTRSRRDVSITPAEPPQGPAGLLRSSIEGVSTAPPRRDATSYTLPGPQRHGDLQTRAGDTSLTARCLLALLVGFAIPFAAAAGGILAATPPGTISPPHILLELFRFAWNGPVAAAIRILGAVGLALFPLVCLVAIAALVELARPGRGNPIAHHSGENPWK